MGKTIVLEDVFNDFILAGKFPRDRGGVMADVVAQLIGAWRPDLAPVFTSKRTAYLLGHHPWIDRIRMSMRDDAVQRYSYILSADSIDAINAIIAERRADHQSPATGTDVGL